MEKGRLAAMISSFLEAGRGRKIKELEKELIIGLVSRLWHTCMMQGNKGTRASRFRKEIARGVRRYRHVLTLSSTFKFATAAYLARDVYVYVCF